MFGTHNPPGTFPVSFTEVNLDRLRHGRSYLYGEDGGAISDFDYVVAKYIPTEVLSSKGEDGITHPYSITLTRQFKKGEPFLKEDRPKTYTFKLVEDEE